MNILLFIFSIGFLILGGLIMRKNKFYKHDISDMLFATKLSVFLSGSLFSLIGLWGIISEIRKLFL
jgi:hypothetical protein